MKFVYMAVIQQKLANYCSYEVNVPNRLPSESQITNKRWHFDTFGGL